MSYLKRSYLFITLIFVALTASTGMAVQTSPDGAEVTITVSGTVTGPDGPVPGVWVWVGSAVDWQDTTSDADGFYSVTLQHDSGGDLSFQVRPEVNTRLTQVDFWMHNVTADVTKDFTLEDGHLLELELPVRNLWPKVQPLYNELPEMYAYNLDWDHDARRYRAVLPPDVYYVTAHDPPAGYFETSESFDLRWGDVSAEMALNREFVHPIPFEPPDASKISVGSVDGLGEAIVTGAPGAVLPFAHVLLVNLNSTHQAHVISEFDGSFDARLFAPPGSAIMVKHGPPDWRWTDVDLGAADSITPFSGTIVHVPFAQTGDPTKVAFATAGAIETNTASRPQTVGAAWAEEGTLSSSAATVKSLSSLDDSSYEQDSFSHVSKENSHSIDKPLSFGPGDSISVEATMRLYGHAIDAAVDPDQISVEAGAGLMMLSDTDGNPFSALNHRGSTRLTASGLPILHQDRAMVSTDAFVAVTNLAYIGGKALEGDLNLNIQIPDNIPVGIYRPVIQFTFHSVPVSTDWHAAHTHHSTFNSSEAGLAPVVITAETNVSQTVESPDTHLTWYLLMNDVFQGIRGTGAREDHDIFQSTSFIATQGAPYVIPAVDTHTSQPMTYRIEPFLPMLSVSDRGAPAQPLIPLDLPGGQLCVSIRQPDGDTQDLGCEAFAQSFVRTPTTREGMDLNGGSVQVSDIYSLKAGSDRFQVTFEEYGHHTITMTGTVIDIWGNTYNGGGTYDVWVADILDLDAGVLPGTPLAVSDVFNPAIRISPGVPAEVHLTLTHYAYSDPTQVEQFTVTGQANEHGYFSANGIPISFEHPGEYRVDLEASYNDPASGRLYMGTSIWGGIVMSPPEQAQLIAHGRRGYDSLEYIPSQWFINCKLDPPPPPGSTSHMFNPYFNGDMIWSMLEADQECDGFALRMTGSIQDTVGDIEAAIQDRFQKGLPNINGPGSFEERVLVDELPLFSSSISGLPVQLMPEDAAQVAYAYLSAQRPGIRVREVIAEDSQTSGYWRLGALYDGQLGVGVQGDLPNDFKFQYVGVVYRDLERGYSEYLGQGSGWIHLPDDDPTGSRVMPPFSGPGNGGWPTQGGPLMTLKGKDVQLFILPTGVRPGQILETGDTFHFGGHIMPTLDSMVRWTATAPSGAQFTGGGRANQVGYYYDPDDDFSVSEPGVWTVDVQVWHDGQIGSGEHVNCDPGDPFNSSLPCPSGDVLGSESGRFWFYVVVPEKARLPILSPRGGYLHIQDEIPALRVAGLIPQGLEDVTVDYTITMPGFILEQGQATLDGSTFSFNYDPVRLNQDFPNLDLIGREDYRPGLADTVTISIMLSGAQNGEPYYSANSVLLQGQEVIVGDFASVSPVHLPVFSR